MEVQYTTIHPGASNGADSSQLWTASQYVKPPRHFGSLHRVKRVLSIDATARRPPLAFGLRCGPADIEGDLVLASPYIALRGDACSAVCQLQVGCHTTAGRNTSLGGKIERNEPRTKASADGRLKNASASVGQAAGRGTA